MLNKAIEIKPISKHRWPKGTKSKVSIICHTYNHEDFISEAIESFLMQRTNFPVEIIISDDCSNDNTTKILKKYEESYPDIIKPVYRSENLYSKVTPIWYEKMFELLFTLEGDYIANCDGDDYWIVNNKLQLQFETLEKNSNYIFCSHITENYSDIKLNQPKYINFTNILDDKMIAHSSSFFFKNIFKNKNLKMLPDYLFYGHNGDYALSIFLTQNSCCLVLPYKMSHYRKNSTGSYTSLKNNKGIIKKAQSLLNINQKIKYYFGSDIFLKLSKKNIHYALSINKRNILSLNFVGLFVNTCKLCLILIEYISASILLYLQKNK